MKTLVLFRCSLVLCLLALATLASAQTPTAAPVATGYWNIETNLTTRDYTIVRFYNAQDQLVYEARLLGLCLDLGKGSGRCRRRVSQRLSVALQEVLREPAAAGLATARLAGQFGQNRRVQHFYALR